MRRALAILTYGIRGNAPTVDIGLAVLRMFVGLAFMTVFEKFLPREGVWGPQPWFVAEVAEMGFPAPTLFAWLAVLSEFFGGLFLILGLGTRLAAFLTVFVTGIAAFVYHDGDVGQTGLNATVFFTLSLTLMLAGPGRFSGDGLICRIARGASPAGGVTSSRETRDTLVRAEREGPQG